MNTKEINFAYRVRHALNEQLDQLPAATTDRLAAARKAALARKKNDAPLGALAFERKFVGLPGGFFSEPLSWVGRMGLLIPVIALVAGLIGLFELEQQHRILETAEIDALVLADELPLSAYLDHGFNAYLAQQDN